MIANEKVSCREFLSAVEPEHRAFVEELNNKLIERVAYCQAGLCGDCCPQVGCIETEY